MHVVPEFLCNALERSCLICYRWYAVRVSIEPCAMSTSLSITAQECGKSVFENVSSNSICCLLTCTSVEGTQQDLSSTPLHLRRQLEKRGLRSQVFLVRYIQQEARHGKL